MSSPIYIAIVEPSHIIREGLVKIFENYYLDFQAFYFNTCSSLSQYGSKSFIKIVIVNSELSSNETDILQKQKSQFENAKWIGLISISRQRSFSKLVNDVIFINDEPKIIINTINNLLNVKADELSFKTKLSDREIDVLKLLVKGNMNKEVANVLNISIHTVITHRKNITTKLGIKSTAAMAIYAVANNIIEIDAYLDEFQ